MAQLVQDSGGGWATSRPVGGQEKTPTTGQKQLRGKMVNLITAGSIKKSQMCIVNNNRRTRKNNRKHRKKEEKEIESREKQRG